MPEKDNPPKDDLQGFLDDLEGKGDNPQDMPQDTPQDTPQDQPQDKPPESQIPDKFKDKKPEEIIQMYMELEKKMGQQSEELGNLRKQMEILTNVLEQAGAQPQGTGPEQKPPEQAQPSIDDILNEIAKEVAPSLYDNPQDSLVKYGKNLFKAIDSFLAARGQQFQNALQHLYAMQVDLLHNMFVSKYPELRGKEDLITLAHKQISSQPNWQMKYMKGNIFDRETYWDDLAKTAKQIGGLEKKPEDVLGLLEKSGAEPALIEKVKALLSGQKTPPRTPPPTNVKQSRIGNKPTIADEIEELAKI